MGHPEHLQLVQEDKVQDQAYRSPSQQQGKRLKKDSVVDVFIIFTASISSLLDVFPRTCFIRTARSSGKMFLAVWPSLYKLLSVLWNHKPQQHKYPFDKDFSFYCFFHVDILCVVPQHNVL